MDLNDMAVVSLRRDMGEFSSPPGLKRNTEKVSQNPAVTGGSIFSHPKRKGCLEDFWGGWKIFHPNHKWVEDLPPGS